eukprot:218193_1
MTTAQSIESIAQNKLKAIEETKFEEESNSFIRKRRIKKHNNKSTQSLTEQSTTIETYGYDGTFTSINIHKTKENKTDDITQTDTHYSANTTDVLSDDDITVNDEPNTDALQRIETESINANIINIPQNKQQSEHEESDNDGSIIALDPQNNNNNNDTSGSDQDMDDGDKLDAMLHEILSTQYIE